jgi:hypothetical protein
MPKKTRSSPSIHPSIKEALGYDTEEPDAAVYADWKERKTRVCKPCWELKYCPYGPLVEQSPTLPSPRQEAMEHVERLQEALRAGFQGTADKLTDEQRIQFKEWAHDDELILRQAIYQVRDQHRLDEIVKLDNDEDKLREFVGGELPPIHIYRASFETAVDEPIQSDFPPHIWAEIEAKAIDIKAKYTEALRIGFMDDRRPIHPVRRLWLEHMVRRDTEALPEAIPETFAEAECNIYGHVCPVFFAAEASTETSTDRRRGRYISFKTKMRVVRRDNHTCQHCGKHLRDDEVEFDHTIPIAKGGSSEEHNIRLTCFDCNRDKSDAHVP